MYEKTVKLLIECLSEFVDINKFGTIVELGARDCQETIAFSEFFKNASIYAFECNPMTLPLCREAIKNLSKVHLIEKAISDIDGKIKFYPIDPEQTQTTWIDGNPGASSIFKASGKYPIETYIQKEIEVESTTLQSFMEQENIEEFDLLWMDIQGAELLALQSLGTKINKVKIIHTEVEFFEIYSGQPLFIDIYNYLYQKGFYLIKFTSLSDYAGDTIFINKNMINHKIKLWKTIWNSQFLFWLQKNNFLRSKSVKFIKNIMRKIYNKFRHFFLKKPSLFIRSKRKLYFFWYKKFELWFAKSKKVSNLSIDVVILAIRKDLITLPIVIDSVRKYVTHPIKEIIIIAPDDDEIKKLCDQKHCKFFNENTILSISKKDIQYIVDNQDRSGWIFQQLIKLGSEVIVDNSHYLVIDADTILLSNQSFKHNDKVIFKFSDEYHQPYYETFHKLLGYKPRLPLSFISHHMLFEKNKLQELKKHIEKRHNKPWFIAIIDCLDKTQASSFSEYETYGHFVEIKYSKSVFLEYWFNLNTGKYIENLDVLHNKLSKKYKSISFHEYI